MIDRYSFGRIVVDGTTYTNDIKIIDASVIPEWWRKRGHNVFPEDVSDLADCDAQYVVIGKGNTGNMSVSAEARQMLKDRGMDVIEENTAQAVETFNRLQKEGKRVCAGFHLTC